MRKVFIFGMLIFVFLLVSCASDEEIPQEQEVDMDTNQMKEDSETLQEENTIEKQKEDDDTQDVDAEEDIEESIGSSLTGYELLESIDIKENNQLYVEATTQVDGSSYVTRITTYNDNLRVETEDEFGSNLMIYNASEGATYMYNSIEGQGIMYYDEETNLDMELLTEDEEFDTSFDGSYIQNVEGLTRAEMTTLDGMEVLYMESQTEMGETDYMTKEWISTKYWYPIKTEIYIENELTSSYQVNEIMNDFTIDASTFLPPEEIEFINMDQIYEMYDMEEAEQ